MELAGKTIWSRTLASPLSEGTCGREGADGAMTLVCFGQVSSGAAPKHWECADSVAFADEQLCKRPLSSSDRAPELEAAESLCSDAIEDGKLIQRCEPLARPRNAMPEPGSACEPGTRRWCDGVTFCGWGIIECPAAGKWPTTSRRDAQGRTHLVDACKEHPDALRPDTPCARYSWLFNPECCEREDCMLPAQSNGRRYAPSAGKLCDPCSPVEPECKEPGALCVYLKRTLPNELIGGANFPIGETYCGRECGANRPCPEGYACALACAVSFQGAPTCSHQCVPSSQHGSCYRQTRS